MIKVKLNTAKLNCDFLSNQVEKEANRYTASWCEDLPEGFRELSYQERYKTAYPYAEKAAAQMGFTYASKSNSKPHDSRSYDYNWYFYRSKDIPKCKDVLIIDSDGIAEPKILDIPEPLPEVIEKANRFKSGSEFYKQYGDNYVFRRKITNSNINKVIPYVYDYYYIEWRDFGLRPYTVFHGSLITPEQAENKVPVDLDKKDFSAYIDHRDSYNLKLPITDVDSVMKTNRKWTTKSKKYITITCGDKTEETDLQRITGVDAEAQAKQLSIDNPGAECQVWLDTYFVGDNAYSDESDITWINGKPYSIISYMDVQRYVN